MIKVKRYFLELKLEDYRDLSKKLSSEFVIELDEKKDFTINKFFYKQIGNDHHWKDRLIWTDEEWFEYVSNKNLQTWILKKNENLIGYYESEHHGEEVELINMGVLKEYREKKYGSALLSHVIKKTFEKRKKRIWVHTCSLDHKHALQNYKSKGLKIFKEEKIDYVA